MADRISSVTGTLALENMGRTLMHEHVMVGVPGWYLDNRRPRFERDEALARTVDAFAELRHHGVGTVVDPCPMDLGRDVTFSAEVAQRSGINIVCATGVYHEAMSGAWVFRPLEAEAIAEIFIREIEVGIGDTGIRAGVVKIATGGDHVTDYERKMIEAAGIAAHATGVPVMSHTENCRCGHDQIDLLTGKGVAPERFLVGHCDSHDAEDYQCALAERGAYVGLDRFGSDGIVPDAVRIRNLMAMVARGHLERIMISHDSVNCLLGGVPGLVAVQSLSEIEPNSRLTHIFETVLPQLREAGLSDDQIDTILVQNPRRFFQ
jgi:phosphotriesterase-related protein